MLQPSSIDFVHAELNTHRHGALGVESGRPCTSFPRIDPGLKMRCGKLNSEAIHEIAMFGPIPF